MPSELPDLAIVVRGGVLGDWSVLREDAIEARDTLGFYALSVFAKVRGPAQSVDAVVRELARRGNILNGKVRVTTAGRLRARGFALRQTGSNPLHYSVDLGGSDLAVVARFVNSFGPARRNPR